MNYTELKQAIQDYAENTDTDFVTHIPDFVKHAEQRALFALRFVANPTLMLTPAKFR